MSILRFVSERAAAEAIVRALRNLPERVFAEVAIAPAARRWPTRIDFREAPDVWVRLEYREDSPQGIWIEGGHGLRPFEIVTLSHRILYVDETPGTEPYFVDSDSFEERIDEIAALARNPLEAVRECLDRAIDVGLRQVAFSNVTFEAPLTRIARAVEAEMRIAMSDRIRVSWEPDPVSLVAVINFRMVFAEGQRPLELRAQRRCSLEFAERLGIDFSGSALEGFRSPIDEPESEPEAEAPPSIERRESKPSAFGAAIIEEIERRREQRDEDRSEP